MSDNRLTGANSNRPIVKAPADCDTPEKRQKWWVQRGNRILWGQEPNAKGEYQQPRPDLEWRCENGSYYIASVGNRPLRLASNRG